jgi:inosine-uridine nucleoside N-ribohydrolase
MLLDTDIGTDVDDAIALVFAALDPRLDLRAVTTVNGDTNLRARIARRLLEYAGRPEVPVGAGERQGLCGGAEWKMPLAFGHEGLGIDLAADGSFPSAEDVIVATLSAAEQPVTVCTVGAVSNVARALFHHPELVDRVRSIHVMGGALGPVSFGDPTNTTAPDPYFDFNLSCDPWAAALLFALPVPLQLVPEDVTMRLMFTDADRQAIRNAGALGSVLDALMEQWLTASRERMRARGRTPDLAAVRLHDPLTVAGIVEPELEVMEDWTLAVMGAPGRLQTVRTPHGRPVRVCRDADEARLRRLLVETLTAPITSRAGTH